MVLLPSQPSSVGAHLGSYRSGSSCFVKRHCYPGYSGVECVPYDSYKATIVRSKENFTI